MVGAHNSGIMLLKESVHGKAIQPSVRGEESDGSVVAVMPGNAGGAKGP
jgi:hypothetical protein